MNDSLITSAITDYLASGAAGQVDRFARLEEEEEVQLGLLLQLRVTHIRIMGRFVDRICDLVFSTTRWLRQKTKSKVMFCLGN